MPNRAEPIIERIFAVGAEDETTHPVLPRLRDAYERGEWKPDVLARIVDEAMTAEDPA